MLKMWLQISSPSVGKVEKQQYEPFTFIMAVCHLHLNLHTHSIHSKMPYLRNTQKNTIFVVLCVTSKKKHVAGTLEMPDVKF